MFQSSQIVSKDDLLTWGEKLSIEFKTQVARKGEIFLKHDQRCFYFYYVSKGFVRLFYLDLEGKEITHWFSSEHMMITSPFSFFKNEPNILNFEALEDTELILVTREQYFELYEKDDKANKAFFDLSAEFAMRLSRSVMSIHTETAQFRYLKLLEEHPLIFQKAKLAHIASYLGITQQSLSRIRKNLTH